MLLDPEVMRTVLEPIIAQVAVAIVETLSGDVRPSCVRRRHVATSFMLVGGGALLPGLDDVGLRLDPGLVLGTSRLHP